MAEIDTSFYRQQPQNPLDNLSKTVGIANSVEQNRLLQGQQTQQGISIDKARLELAVSQLGQLRSMFAPQINNPNVTSKDITQIGVDAIKQGIATPQQVATELSGFPKDGSGADRLRWVRDRYVRTLSHENQINMMLGTPQVLDTGGGKTIIQQPLRPDQGTAQRGAVPNTLAPGTQIYNPATRQLEVSPQGQPGQFAPSNAAPISSREGNTPKGGKPQSAIPASSQSTSSVPATPSVAGKDNGRLPTGAPLGEGEAAGVAGSASGNLLAKDRESGANYRREVMPLEQAIPKLEKLGKTGTGPGTEEVNNIKSFLQSAGLPGFDQEKIKNFDEAKKYLTDWVMANGNSGTNDKLAASFASNANVGISNAAAVDVAKTALALRRMRQAQLTAFEQSGLPENKYSQWAAQWNAKVDPRVYGFDLMSPGARNKLLASLPAGKDGKIGKRELFIMQVEDAERAGMLSPPQMQMSSPEERK
jgi:hypothetical protein